VPRTVAHHGPYVEGPVPGQPGGVGLTLSGHAYRSARAVAGMAC